MRISASDGELFDLPMEGMPTQVGVILAKLYAAWLEFLIPGAEVS